jgi:hypothetical protein
MTVTCEKPGVTPCESVPSSRKVNTVPRTLREDFGVMHGHSKVAEADVARYNFGDSKLSLINWKAIDEEQKVK